VAPATNSVVLGPISIRTTSNAVRRKEQNAKCKSPLRYEDTNMPRAINRSQRIPDLLPVSYSVARRNMRLEYDGALEEHAGSICSVLVAGLMPETLIDARTPSSGRCSTSRRQRPIVSLEPDEGQQNFRDLVQLHRHRLARDAIGARTFQPHHPGCRLGSPRCKAARWR